MRLYLRRPGNRDCPLAPSCFPASAHGSDIFLSTPHTIGLCQDLTHLFNQLHWLVWFLNESGQAPALKMADGLPLVVSAREDHSDLRPNCPDRPKDFFAGYVRHGHIQHTSPNLVRVSS